MTYDKGTQCRKWILVINNPEDHGLTIEKIIELLMLFHPDYFCLAAEISSTGTYHIHIFLFSTSAMRFGTVKGRFPTAHIEMARGSCFENREYIRKGGKWTDTEKADTRVEGTFYEFGDLPTPAAEKNPKHAALIEYVENGLSNRQILDQDASFALKTRDIDVLRQELKFEQYLNVNRDIQVHYLFGDSGTGKTRSIYEKHPAADICRITHYPAKGNVQFDAYKGQPVLVFEEFHSQIPITSMLNFLDIYPVMLPARYFDRVACYTTVYITSNIPLEQQYPEIQKCKLETWNAFLRRIQTVTEFRKDGIIREVKYENNENP